MNFNYTYKPVEFYLIAILGTWLFLFTAAYFSYKKSKNMQSIFIFPGILVPFGAALYLIFSSNNHSLIEDFLSRIFLFKLNFASAVLIFIIFPALFFLSIAISMLFGKSKKQFGIESNFKVMKGWGILGLLVAILIAPAIEEWGWRGYGVDSLMSNFNLFYTSLIFALLWGLWHLPLFFIKGYYHYELVKLNFVYVINFFVSLIPIVFLMNWVFYTNYRSILIIILFHAVINGLSVIFKAEQFTKCIFTILLAILSIFMILKDKEFFFKPGVVSGIYKECPRCNNK